MQQPLQRLIVGLLLFCLMALLPSQSFAQSPGADLTITKSDNGATVIPGATLPYTLNYANAGPAGASGVMLTEVVPLNTTFNPGASTAGWLCAPNNNAGSVCSLTIGNLTPGANGSVTFAVSVVNPVPTGVFIISNTVNIMDDGASGVDPVPANNTSTETTSVNTPTSIQVATLRVSSPASQSLVLGLIVVGVLVVGALLRRR